MDMAGWEFELPLALAASRKEGDCRPPGRRRVGARDGATWAADETCICQGDFQTESEVLYEEHLGSTADLKAEQQDQRGTAERPGVQQDPKKRPCETRRQTRLAMRMQRSTGCCEHQRVHCVRPQKRLAGRLLENLLALVALASAMGFAKASSTSSAAVLAAVLLFGHDLFTSPGVAAADAAGAANEAEVVAAAIAAARLQSSLPNRTRDLIADRERAERHLHEGIGYVWFQHMRRAGGTSLCSVLQTSSHATFFRGQACQPSEWNLRDALKFNNDSLSLLEAKLEDWKTNAFAQEYGPVPGPALIGDRLSRAPWRRWVFVTSLRDPWQRFWSQLRHEMTPCLASVQALRVCARGEFDQIQYWSPFSHVDAILGVPVARLSSGPRIYADNYYTRVLINKTDTGTPVTVEDFEMALQVLKHRFTAVVISDFYAQSTLQLACALGINLTKVVPMLRTKTRPYAIYETWFNDLPQTAWDMGEEGAILEIKTNFVKGNLFDYSLLAHAKQMASRRLRACARKREDVRELLKEFPKKFVPAPPAKQESGYGIDDIFGCVGGSLSWDEKKGSYVLICPRSSDQHGSSWWNNEGLRIPGEECWSEGFSWNGCCHPHYGPTGNSECWDERYNFTRCCI